MKNRVRILISLLILFVLYTVCYFAIPYPQKDKTVFALVYVFVTLAFVLQIYPYYICFVKEEDLKSKFYGLPLIRISLYYLVAALVLNFLFNVINAFVALPVLVCTLLNILLLGFSVIGFLAAEGYKEEIEKVEKIEKINTTFIDDLKANARALKNKFNYDPLKAKMKKLHDIVIYSDPISSQDLLSLEDEITRKFNLLQEVYSNKEYDKLEEAMDELINLIDERNLRCKKSK